MFDSLDENIDPAEELMQKYKSGEIDRDTFMQQMDSLAYTDHSMRQGEMGMMGDDTPEGHRNWARDEADWNGLDDEFDSDIDGEIDEASEQSPAYAQALARAEELRDSMVDPNEAADIIAGELSGQGLSDDEVADILVYVADNLDTEPDIDTTCPACHGTGEGQTEYDRCSSCHGSGEINGRVDQDDFVEPDDYTDDDYIGPLEESDEESDEDVVEEEVVDEAYDLNNGYEDVKYSKGSDYFPTGADSPVTSHTGPSGARQGDNPEQKKMEVSEAHKELVYNYRKFLKESVKK